jgi:DNA repair protein RadA/Sms
MLFTGPPGHGKSTVAFLLAAAWARAGGEAVYYPYEEGPGRVRRLAERIGAGTARVFIGFDSFATGAAAAAGPLLVVVDSLQAAVELGHIPSLTAGVVRAQDLRAERDATVVLIGHVTKEDKTAGPRALEHQVDVLLNLSCVDEVGRPLSPAVDPLALATVRRVFRIGPKNRVGPASVHVFPTWPPRLG